MSTITKITLAVVDWGQVGAIANWVIALGTLASVIVIIVSVKNLQRTLESSAYQSIHEEMTHIHITLLTNPKFRLVMYGDPYRSVEASREADASLETAAEMVIDLFDNIFCQRDVIPKRSFEGFEEYMKMVYQRSVYLQAFLTDHADWYSSEFLEYIGHKPVSLTADMSPASSNEVPPP